MLNKVLFSLNTCFKPTSFSCTGSERKSVQAQSPKSKFKVLFQTASDLLKSFWGCWVLVITGRHLQWFQGAHCSHSFLLLNQKQGVPMAGAPFLGRGRESGGQIQLPWEEQTGFSGYGRTVTYQEFEVWVVQLSWKGGGIDHGFCWSGNSHCSICCAWQSQTREVYFVLFSVCILGAGWAFLAVLGWRQHSGLLPGLQGVNWGSTAAQYRSELSCCQRLLL